MIDLSSESRDVILLTGVEKMNHLDAYRPQPSWFTHKPHGIHGIGHAARVLVWADLIARRLQACDISLDLEAVRWAAVLHDVGRLSDGIDRGHGSRSATWVKNNRGSLPIVPPGDCVSLSGDDTIERVLTCCQWHEIGDGEIPAMTPELMCIKDADGLDRVRINDLNPAYLRSGPARLLVEDARALFCATRSAGDPWVTCIQYASGNGE
jgi:hypothetical protein